MILSAQQMLQLKLRRVQRPRSEGDEEEGQKALEMKKASFERNILEKQKKHIFRTF